VDKAVHYLLESGKKSLARYAIDEADAHFRAGFRILSDRERTPDEDRALVELLVEWAFAFYHNGNFGELRRLLEAHEHLAERVGAPGLQAFFLGWVGYVLYFAEEHTAAIEKLERAGRLAASSGSTRTIAYIQLWKSFPLWETGRLAEAIAAAEAGRALAFEVPSDLGLRGWSFAAVGQSSASAGDFERARRIAEDLIALARETEESRAAEAGYSLLAQINVITGEFERTIEFAEAARSMSRNTMGRALALLYLALGRAGAQQFAECRAAAEELLAWATPCSARVLETPARAVRAIAWLGEGRLSEGMADLLALHDEVTRRGSANHATWMTFSIGLVYARIARREVPLVLGSLLRNPGFLLRHALPARRKARAWLERALANSQRSEFKAGEGSARLELAALLARSDPAAARAHLGAALPLLERQDAPTALARARALAATLGAG
jgi:hypothetical protein